MLLRALARNAGMFERYTEKARRTIFFARYEASQFGADCIETEHLLLGLLREDKALAHHLLGSHSGIESIRKQIEAHTPKGEKVSTSVDMPLSQESRRALAYAAEEQMQSGQNYIGPGHLVLGLLREEKCYAAGLLRERGITPAAVREAIDHPTAETPSIGVPARAGVLTFFTRDLTQEMAERSLQPSDALDSLVNHLIEVLGRRTKCNPVLLGDDPKSKIALVKRLAQRIVAANVPRDFADKRILWLDLFQVAAGTASADQLHARLSAIFDELARDPDVIAFLVNDLETLFGSQVDESWKDAAIILAPALNIRRIHCICTSKPAEFRALLENHPLLASKFTAIDVPPNPLGRLSWAADKLIMASGRKLPAFGPQKNRTPLRSRLMACGVSPEELPSLVRIPDRLF